MTAQQLKNSILQLAVQGKLVPQDPSDEPASVLLERIRKEKEALIKAKKIKKEKNPSVIFRGADNTPYEKIGNEVVPLDVPFDIPDSWEWVRLGTLLSVISDGTHKTPNYVENGVPFLSVQNISKGFFDLSKLKYITETEHKKLCERVAPQKDDILICRIGTLGKAIKCTLDIEFSIFVSLGLLRVIDPSVVDYIVFAINSPVGDKWIQENKVGGGTHTYKINLSDLPNMLIPLPPIEEQIRIFQKMKELEPLLFEYNNADNCLEALSNSFPDMLKKSILQWAVQGKLVPQDENDEPAEVLLKRIRAEKEALIKAGKIKRDKSESVIFRRDNSHYEKRGSKEICIDEFVPFELPHNWQWERLINIYNFIDYRGATPTKIEAGIPLITAKNVKKGYIDYKIRDYISESEYKTRQSRGISQKGDLLFTTEAPLGNVALADIEHFSAGQRLITLQKYTSSPLLNNSLVMYFLLSDCFQSQLLTHSTGTTVKGIKAEKLKQLWVPVPPYKEQLRILAQLEKVLDYCSTL